MSGVFASALDAIGETPMIELARYFAGSPHRVFAKCEFLNPGGSIKDRIGRAMVAEARASGALAPGGTIVEATAGNTGIGLALAAIALGHPLIAVMTTKASAEKVQLMAAFGAEVVRCPYAVPPDHRDHFIATARRIAAATPGAWFADQFANPANRTAHETTTGPEIWRQTGGRVNLLVAGIGTGGTLCGAGAYLKARSPATRLVAADPEGSILASCHRGAPAAGAPYLIEGIGGDFVPPLADLAIIDQVETVPDAAAIAAAHRLIRTEGLFAGGSAGTILAATERVLAAMPAPQRVVVILPDGGRSYLSTIYHPGWRAAQGLPA
ncbi:MAG: hypothetical protein B7Y43_00225 [Sphingomonas sp. 28-62-20]|uniref:PLP-dependent cysteine synthase family protein n=1 Tax=Sphingomonas sp. 28-62-20 TaxID=1970433 RepID=UPI000BD3218F|nr:MAG: hypothetical protein B7Y43_00225 [Sphingomonas sp. 28-62-20]